MKQLLPFMIVVHLTAALLTIESEVQKDVRPKQMERLSKMIGKIAVDPTMGAIYEQNEDNHYLDLPIDDHFGLRAEIAAEAKGRKKQFGQPKPLTTKKPASPPNEREDYDSPEKSRREASETLARSVQTDYEYTDGDDFHDIEDRSNLMKPSKSGKRVANRNRYHRRNHRDKSRSYGRRPFVDGTEDYGNLDYGETDQNLARSREDHTPQIYEDDYEDIPEARTRRKSRKRQRKNRKGKKNRKDRFRDESYDYEDLHDHYDHKTRNVPVERTYDFDAYDLLGNSRNTYEDFEDYSPKRRHNKSKRRHGRKFYGRERQIPNYHQIYDDDSDESFEDYGDLRWALRQDHRNHHHYGRRGDPLYFDQNHHLYSQHDSNPGSGYHNTRRGGSMGMVPAVPVSPIAARGTVDRLHTTETPLLNENSEDRVHNVTKEPKMSTSSKSDLLPGFTPPEGITYDIHDISAQPSQRSNSEQSEPNHDLDYPVDVGATGSETQDWNAPATSTTRKPVEPVNRNRFRFTKPDRSSHDRKVLSPVEHPVDEDTTQRRGLVGNAGYQNVFDEQEGSMIEPAYSDYDYNDPNAQVTPPPNPYHQRVPQYPHDRTSIYDRNLVQQSPHHHTLQNPYPDMPYDPLDFIGYRPRVRDYLPSGAAFPSAQTPWDPNRNFRASYLGYHPNERSNFMGRFGDYNSDPLFPDDGGYRVRLPIASHDHDFSDNALDLPSLPDDYNTEY